MRTPLMLTAGALALSGLTACSSTSGGGDTSAQASGKPGKITVAATDTDCKVSAADLPAGTSTFSITNNGSKVTEFYVYAAGDRIMGEVENIVPGLTREVLVELPAGAYEAACKPGMIGKGIRNPLKVSGAAVPLTGDAKLAKATADYQRYVKTQSDTLLVKTQEFVDAVKAGDVAKAKSLFPIARTYWERIEPVAEIFGDLDPRIDGREEIIGDGMPFTGFHAIEKALWTTGDVSKSGPMADQLMVDVKEVVAKSTAERLNPLQLANGAKELLDEVASRKITGEEDRYSHTDLWDFHANVEGSKAAIASLRPILEERAPALVKSLEENFSAVEAALGKHVVGDGWKLHTELSDKDKIELSDVINALARPISEVGAAVSGK
jgi:iron uptake system component EfeO